VACEVLVEKILEVGEQHSIVKTIFCNGRGTKSLHCYCNYGFIFHIAKFSKNENLNGEYKELYMGVKYKKIQKKEVKS
jgi:hypothetical protein